MIFWLAACASAPDPPPALLWVSEADGGPQVAGRALDLPPGATFPGDPDPKRTHALVIATEDDPRGHRETLWLVPLDGGESTRLHAAGRVRNPSFDSGGDALFFESDATSFRDLFRVARDGSGLKRLTDAPGGSFEPTLSPDGTELALGSSRSGSADIHLLRLAGPEAGQTRQLTQHRSDDVQPRWTSDGQLSWLAFRQGRARVWLYDSDGGRPLRAGDGTDLEHSWSPTGDRVAITVAVDDGTTALELVSRDGRLLARLDGPGPDEHPAWSPDGSQLAFTSSRAGHPDIWVTDAAGSSPRRVTYDPVAAWLPRWMRAE